MAILISAQSRVMVQGITGKSGALQTKMMLDAGTHIVAGVTPGKGGQTVHGIPVFNSAAEAQAEIGFDTAICFVPARAAKDSVIEVVDAGAKLLVLTTEEIPTHDVAALLAYARAHGTTIVGPGCSGIIAPGVCKVGSHPVRFFRKGSIGVVSKSGALSYEVGKTLSEAGLGSRRSSVWAAGRSGASPSAMRSKPMKRTRKPRSSSCWAKSAAAARRRQRRGSALTVSSRSSL